MLLKCDLPLPSCQIRTIVLSIQAWACSIETISAPHSSRRGIGATLDLTVTSAGDMFPDESVALMYTTPMYALSEASEKSSS